MARNPSSCSEFDSQGTPAVLPKNSRPRLVARTNDRSRALVGGGRTITEDVRKYSLRNKGGEVVFTFNVGGEA